jgi:hypothetical protein
VALTVLYSASVLHLISLVDVIFWFRSLPHDIFKFFNAGVLLSFAHFTTVVRRDRKLILNQTRLFGYDLRR